MKPTRNASEPNAAQRMDEKETGRVEAFSDGVFAIAITLLILGITVPLYGGNNGSLIAAVGTQWASFLAYALSFITILIMWVNHHNLFRQIRHIDQAFLIINGLLLMMITFVNYPTALLADTLKHLTSVQGNSDQKAAAAIYSGTFVVVAILYNALWNYAKRDGRLLAVDQDAAIVDLITRQYRFGPLFYVIAFVLAFVSAPASIAANIILAVYFMFTGTERRS